ncbi:restriction endonuclease subunit S [Streptococcus pluranimalium]
MVQQQKTPTLRFKDFDDEWEKVLLNEIVSIVGGGTPSTSVDEYWDGDINWFSPTEVGESVYVTESDRKITQLGLEKSSAKILPADKTILFTSRAGIGDAAILKTDSTTNQGFQSLVLDDKTDIYFLYSQKENLKRYATKNAAGSTFLEISGKELGKMPIIIPSFPEQSAIGTLFQTLDELLSAYKDNLANYQAFKATMLSKMFPKAGQTTPEIRLDGFDGEWEVNTLNNLATFSKGNGYTKGDLSENGQPIILYGQLYTNYQTVISESATFVAKIKDNSVFSEGGEVIVPASGESSEDISRASVVDAKGILLGGDLNIIKVNQDTVDSVFLALTISNGSQQRELIKRAQGKSVVHLRNNDLEKVILTFLSIEEQRAIGAFFANLDDLIASQQAKITELETLKKKLLQDMFV